MNKGRLLKAMKALRESPHPKGFTMGHYRADCGTPGCVLGHYAARTDLQDAFILDSNWVLPSDGTKELVYFDGVHVRQHFEIASGDAEMLFGPDGCGKAKTPEEAAVFIENFIKARENLFGSMAGFFEGDDT